MIEMQACELITKEFERRAKEQRLFTYTEDFIQDCWLALLEQNTEESLQHRITEAIKSARKQTRPYRLYGEHIVEHPVESIEVFPVHTSSFDQELDDV